MALWWTWFRCVQKLRGAYARRRTFLWMSLVLAGLSIRADMPEASKSFIQKWKPTDRCAERGHRCFAGHDGRGATQQQRLPRCGFQRSAEVLATGNFRS